MTSKRALILFGIFFAMLAALLARIAVLQLASSRSMEQAAFKQRISSENVEKLRGNILDRNGIAFTNRSYKYLAFIKPAYMPKSAEERKKVGAALGLQQEELGQLTSKSKPFMAEIDEKGAAAILKTKPDWVSVVHSLNRYDSNTLARHIIGYLGRKDQTGQAGIEKAYEEQLRDYAVYEIGAITDAAKNPIRGLGYRIRNLGREEALNVKLTLDYHIQQIVESSMEKNSLKGAVVVEDVATGDILAMASKPDFNPQSVENYLNSSGRELFNKATAAYNLGSVFKIIDVAAVYESTDIVPGSYFCEGAINVNGLQFKCSSYYEGGHGEVNLEQAFAKSCNSYFIDLCLKAGYQNLISMAKKFGLGETTGIQEQGIGEARGNLPSPDGYYSQADIANLSIGQGVLLATPLQAADVIATVANGGIKNRVNIVDSIVDDNGKTVKEIRVRQGQRIISKETADKIKSLMEAVTAYGTGTAAGLDYYGGSGGKTGSAETGSSEVVHAWFAGYFPSAEPKYAIVVFVENGKYGGKVAAPVFSEIAREMKDKGY